MVRVAEFRNPLPPLDCEVESAIGDMAASSLSAATSAAGVLRKVDGATREQLLVAAIHLIREQAIRHREITDELTDEAAGYEDQISDLEIKVGDLRTKLKKLTAEKSS